MPVKEIFSNTWPGFDFVFFDCDSTLSTIEGIDELARARGKFAEVKAMTDAAMEGEIHLQSVYDRRLQLLSPNRGEIRRLEQLYRQTVVPNTQTVIAALQQLGKELFIVSGGLLAAVKPFGEWLGIPGANIRAVDVEYNRLSGQWWDYQQDQWGQRPDVQYMHPKESPLMESHGKADVIRELLGTRTGRIVLIGDGMSDVAARPAVDWVIGFGGVITRPRVAANADVFIKANTLAPVLPLVLSAPEQQNLKQTPFAPLLQKGLQIIESDDVVLAGDSSD